MINYAKHVLLHTKLGDVHLEMTQSLFSAAVIFTLVLRYEDNLFLQGM